MTYNKTTLFYELQLSRMLEEFEDLDKTQIKSRIEGMLADPNKI